MPYAVDLFCGAGGFSEGILQAGFDIIFSSDKSEMVMKTYVNRHNQLGIIEGRDTHFELTDVRNLKAETIIEEANKLKYGRIFKKGNIDAFFGGPPCQGFSRLGKRDSSDPRNMLFHEYLRLIRDVMPKYVVMENVTGILDMYMLDFPSVLSDNCYVGQHLVKDILKKEIEGIGYTLLDVKVLNAINYGVPQRRNRVVFLAYRNDVKPVSYPKTTSEQITIYDALGDLYKGSKNYTTEFSKASINGRTPSNLTGIPVSRKKLTNMELPRHDSIVQQRFSLYRQGENKYKAMERLRSKGINLLKNSPALFWNSLFILNKNENYNMLLKLIKKEKIKAENKLNNFTFINNILSKIAMFDFENNSLELSNQINRLALKLDITYDMTCKLWKSFKQEINLDKMSKSYNDELRRGNITDEIGEALFTRKNIRSRLDADTAGPTMVTLPDDFINPYFDRILTVREMARIQSFDDSFEFLGKRTTGGKKRRQEVPQYTQVGNAVPPLLAKAIAKQVLKAVEGK